MVYISTCIYLYFTVHVYAYVFAYTIYTYIVWHYYVPGLWIFVYVIMCVLQEHIVVIHCNYLDCL